jgi:cobalt ECF transporter T component CbiQ
VTAARFGRGYLERAVDTLRVAIEQADSAARVSRRPGLLQAVDPRVKVIGLLALAVSVTFTTSLRAILGVLAFAVLLAAASRIPPAALAVRVWLGVVALTAAIAAPALFLVPGDVVWRLPPGGWPVTGEGLMTAAYLLLRVATAATLAWLLVFTTPWAHVLKALRALRMPLVFVVVLGLTWRYILLLLEAAHDMFESRRSRTAGALPASEARRLAIDAAGALLARTLYLSGEVHLAMQARGFRGQPLVLDEFRMRARDWATLVVFVATALLSGWIGQ